MKTKTYQRMTLTLSKSEAKAIQSVINRAAMRPIDFPEQAPFIQELYNALEEFTGAV